MSLIEVVLAILIAGVLVWAINAFPAIDANFKKIATVLIIAVMVIWILVGIVGGGSIDFLNNDISID